jgi:hypothetical protein
MKNRGLVIFCMTALFIGERCVSFKIEPLAEPEKLVKTLVLCKEIIPAGELLAPVDVTRDFVLGDSGVICFVELANVSQTMTLKWKWYAPGGALFKETNDVPVNESRVYIETVTAYDKLDTQHEERFAGRWVVIVLIDGELAGRQTFSIHGQ